MDDRSLYPNAPAPRFHVGEMVYTHSTLRGTPPYPPPMHTTVQPSVFGVIIDYPEEGTIVLESQTVPFINYEHHVWKGVPTEEFEDAVLDQGSLWFDDHDERMYFVKWINKPTYPFNTQPTEFRPMMSTNGEPVFNISLHWEGELFKAPQFITKLRSKVAERKVKEAMEHVLTERLNIDDCSTKGIADMVTQY